MLLVSTLEVYDPRTLSTGSPTEGKIFQRHGFDGGVVAWREVPDVAEKHDRHTDRHACCARKS